jgi:hypothetical protein
MLFQNQIIPGNPNTEYPKLKTKPRKSLIPRRSSIETIKPLTTPAKPIKTKPTADSPLKHKNKVKTTITFDLEKFADMEICDSEVELRLSLYRDHRRYQDEIIMEVTELIKFYHSNEHNLSLILKNISK